MECPLPDCFFLRADPQGEGEALLDVDDSLFVEGVLHVRACLLPFDSRTALGGLATFVGHVSQALIIDYRELD